MSVSGRVTPSKPLNVGYFFGGIQPGVFYQEPQKSIHLLVVGYQLDDSNSLRRKCLFHQTSIFEWLSWVPSTYFCFLCEGAMLVDTIGKNDYLTWIIY